MNKYKIKYIPAYHTSKYHISPLSAYNQSLYDQFLAFSGLYNITSFYKNQMTYGEYMDSGDALGYDDIAPYNEDYDEALSGIFSSIGTFFGKLGKGIGGIASKTYTFSKKYAVKGWDFTKKLAGKGYSFVKKIPSIGRKAWDWTARAGSNAWRFTKKATTSAYKWKGWKQIGGASLKLVSSVIVAGLKVGAWFIDGVGNLFYVDNEGNVTTPPAGVRPPTQQPQTPYQPQPDSVSYPPSEDGYNPYTQYQTDEPYLPVDLNTGWVIDEATGEPIREATPQEIQFEQTRQAKKKNIWTYVIAGGSIALLLL